MINVKECTSGQKNLEAKYRMDNEELEVINVAKDLGLIISYILTVDQGQKWQIQEIWS